MGSYFIILFVATLIMFLANKTKEVSILSFGFMFLALAVLVFFAGVRDWSVGTDTLNYRDMFVYKRGALGLVDFVGGIEPGYVLFQKFFQELTTSFVAYLFAIAFFVVGINLYLTKKLSENYGITIFVFISLGIYLFFFNGARQAMAAAVYGLAIFPLLKGKFIRYCLLVLLAATFHKTVLVMIPMYFAFKMEVSFKQLVILAIVTTVVTSGLSIVMSIAPTLVNEKYANYANRTSGGGVLLMVVYGILNMAFLYFRRFIHEDDLKKYDVYLNLCMFTVIIYAVVNVFGQDVNLIRFTLYAAFGFMFIWPLILKNLPIFKSIVPWMFFYVVHIVFFYVYITKMIGPYYTNAALF